MTAGELENTLDVDQVKLSRTDATVPGTLKLKEGTVLQYGTHDYSWVFEPQDSANYETIDGTVSITVKDTVAPGPAGRLERAALDNLSIRFPLAIFAKIQKRWKLSLRMWEAELRQNSTISLIRR